MDLKASQEDQSLRGSLRLTHKLRTQSGACSSSSAPGMMDCRTIGGGELKGEMSFKRASSRGAAREFLMIPKRLFLLKRL